MSISEMIAPGQADKAASLAEKRALLKQLLAQKSEPVAHPLSYSQQSLWVQDQFQGPNATYNMKYGLWLDGNLDATILEQCFWTICRRHGTLRTSFRQVDNEPKQLVHPPRDRALPVIDLSSLADRDEQTRRLMVEKACKAFDLTQNPLIRLGLFRLAPNRHVLLLVMHHIISDGWSMSVFLKETIELYEATQQKRPAQLPSQPMQFTQYAKLQQEQVAAGALNEDIAFWKRYLDGAPALLDMPTDYPRPAKQSFRGGIYAFRLEKPLLERLREQARRSGSTLFMTLGSGISALLSRYSAQTDLVIGTPLANRVRPEHRDMIGYFINLLALRVDLSGNPSFTEMVRRFRAMSRDVFAHQALPFDQLINELKLPRPINHQTLVQVMYALHSFEVAPLRLPGVAVDQRPIETGTAKFDLNFQCLETDLGLEIAVEYNSDIFSVDRIRLMTEHLTGLIETFVNDPDQPIKNAPMLSQHERRDLLGIWETRTYDSHLTLQAMFGAQAAARPEAVAVVDATGNITYGELDRRTNQLGNHLRRHGVGRETLVAVSMARSIDMVVALLAVLKSGATYIPVDPAVPEERRRFILEDATCAVMVTQASLEGLFTVLALPGLKLILADAPIIDEESAVLEPMVQDSSQCAYIIYTSGSTGKPKGVAVTHAQVHRLFSATDPWFRFNGDDAFTCFHSFAFDVSVFEIWGALTMGARLIIVDYAQSRSPKDFCDWMVAQKATVLSQTPSAFYPLAEEILKRSLSPEQLPRVIIFAGEALSFAKLTAWFKSYGDRGPKMVNMYGITETCVHTTYHVVTPEQAAFSGSIVGVPIPDIDLYVLDETLNLVPEGVTGELWVGGAAPARGYFGRPKLTAERFAPDPFSGRYGARMYRSGDLTRRIPRSQPWGGNLDYIGRMDHQVKIRGFRIELGEIEVALSRHQQILSAVVLVDEAETGSRLAAFLIAEPGQRPDVAELRTFLAGSLPDYMVPSLFVFLDAMPTTANNKIDRRALLALAATESEVEQVAYVAPRNLEEERLLTIWASTLKLAPTLIGVHGNFFALGGHSLLATSVISRVNEAFETDLSMRTIFEAPTVAEMAWVVSQAKPRIHQPILPFEGGHAPLSITQKRVWFYHQMEGYNSTYNMPAALEIKGDLNLQALDQAVNAVVARHDVLRTSFPLHEEQPYQQVAPPQAMSIQLIGLTHLPKAERDAAARAEIDRESQAPFNLETGPVLRIKLIALDEDQHILLCVMHHIVSDAWSLNIFIKEMVTFYKQFAGLPSEPLQSLPIQFKDYAAWQHTTQGEGAMAQSLAYWKEHLVGAPALLELPTYQPRPAMQTYKGAFSYFQIDAALSRRLNDLAKQADATQFMVVMTAFSTLLSRWSGQRDLVIGSLLAGRNRSEIEPLIGMFVTSQALRFHLADNPSFREHLLRSRREILDGFAHQDAPLDRVVEAVQPPRSLSHSPIFQVLVSHQTLAMDDVSIPGLTLNWLKAETASTNYDIVLTLQERTDGAFGGFFRYNPDLFQEEMIDRMIEQFLNLLNAMQANPDGRVLHAPMLGQAELQNLSLDRQPAWKPYNLPAVVDMVEQQVLRVPDKTAVYHDGETLTFAQLNAKSNQLAHYLRAKGVVHDSRVAIYLHRNFATTIATLAVLKAGACYVPIDPAYPAERRQTMLDDAAVDVIITNLECQISGCTLINPDLEAEVIATQSVENLGLEIHPFNLVYVMYTSGSTGKPKGIALTHECLANLIHWHMDIFPCNVGFLQFGSLSFDAAFHEMFAAWCTGDTLYLVPAESRLDTLKFMEFVHEHRIGKLYLPVAVVHLMGELYATHKHLFEYLDDLIATGEQLHLTRHLVDMFIDRPECKLHNHYGPAETHVITAYTYEGHPSTWAFHTPIGLALPNTQVYVVDPYLQHVPTGALGELYLGGIMMARGYLNRPAQTAAKFVPDPFSGVPGARLYLSADLGRYLPDGNLEYSGRIDHMVKIRGVRIELGEIESLLDKHPRVSRAFVMARGEKSSDKYLAAYAVPDGDASLTSSELREYLSEKLPPYMLPNTIILMASLPVTPNGKVDHRALPVPGDSDANDRYVAPRNAIEEKITAVWAEVLNKPNVGVLDDFFELGGHSLLATQVVSRLRDTLGVQLAIRTLFEAPTPEALALRLDAASSGPTNPAPTLKPMPRGERPELSFAQQRLWFLDRLENLGPAYNMPSALRIQGPLDLEILTEVLTDIVRRHESLRTNFPSVDGEPYQNVEPPYVLRPTLEDIPADADEQWVLQKAHEEAATPFRLGEDRLFRVTLLRKSAEDHYLLFTLHHIIFDGWSFGVLVDEFISQFQNRLTQGASAPKLADLPIQYADFSAWQRQFLSGEELDRQMAYWKGHLAGLPDVMDMPTDFPRPAVQSFRGKLHTFEIEPALLERLEAFSRAHDVTLFMTMMAVYKVLLARYTNGEDLVVGTPIANRNFSELEKVIGFFANTLVMRTDASGAPSFAELLQRVKTNALAAYAHQDLPFEKLVEELRPERNMSVPPLFQMMFVMQNAPMGAVNLPGFTLSPVRLDLVTSKFDMNLMLTDRSNGGLRGNLEYNTDLFRPETVARMFRHYHKLLGEVVAAPNTSIWTLELIDLEERNLLLNTWNDASIHRPEPLKCLHHAFMERAAQKGDQHAAIFSGDGHEPRALTYDELNRRSNQVARYLMDRGVGRNQAVGLFVQRSLELVVGVLGILKSGACIAPMDPTYPAERLIYMMGNAEMQWILVTSETAQHLPENPCQTLSLDTQWPEIAAASAEDVRVELDLDELYYIIYTSGSTGLPKGISLQHRAMANMVRWHLRAVHLGTNFLQFASICFDASYQEMFAAWLAGETLFLIPESLRTNPPALLDHVAANRIGKVNLPVVLVHAWAEAYAGNKEKFAHLRSLLSTGEQLTITPALKNMMTELAELTLTNNYGPSETHIVTSEGFATRDWSYYAPIGKAIDNTQLYVVGRDMQLTPKGIPGRLYLAGDNVARGYAKRPALTAEKFIPNPFSKIPGDRMYDSGDQARYRGDDGTLIYLGRQDHQVKIRGYRIEPGEIEAVLLDHPDLHETVVLTKVREGEKVLVAYVVPKKGRQIQVGGLRGYLQQYVPDYMIPSFFVALDAFPLTSNRKIDRKALPEPDGHVSGEEHKHPTTLVEMALAKIWSEVLHVTAVGLYDDFFALGGHSLSATKVHARVQKTLGVSLALRDLFNHPVLADFAARVEVLRRAGQPEKTPLVRTHREQPLPLSFGQMRLWFIDKLEPESSAYVVSRPVRIDGAIDLDLLNKAFKKVVQRHEILRTVFREVNGKPVQVILDGLDAAIDVRDMRHVPAEQRETLAFEEINEEATTPMNLAVGPLIRVTTWVMGEEDFLLSFSLNHTITDGWSREVLIRDLCEFYLAMQEAREPNLPELTIQYADFAVWQRNLGPVLENQLAYWKNKLSTVEVLELPTDFPRPAVFRSVGAAHHFKISGRLEQALRRICSDQSVTPYMMMMGAFKVLLHRYSGQNNIAVGTSITNRSHDALEQLIGFFVNTQVIYTQMAGNPRYTEFLANLREDLLSAYDNRDLPFDHIVEAVNPKRDQSRHPLFQVMFAYEMAPDHKIHIPVREYKVLDADHVTSNFDLAMYQFEEENGVDVVFEYNTDLFEASTIDRMANNYLQLLASIVADPAQPIDDLNLIPEAERQTLLHTWNQTAQARDQTATLHGLFRNQAAATPDRFALSFPETHQRLTYAELNERVQQLAAQLRLKGVGLDTFVGVCMERSIEMVVALMGVLEAGGAYIPLDPAYPETRVRYIMEQSKAPLVIAQEAMRGMVNAAQDQVLYLNTDGYVAGPKIDLTSYRPVAVQANNAAYMIYTSGSTGRPKGVVLDHRAACNRILWLEELLGKCPEERFLQKTPYTFDVSVVEFFWTLSQGSELVMARPGAQGDPRYLREIIREREITTIHFVPSMLANFLVNNQGQRFKLNQVFASGEALSVELQAQFFETFDSHLFNLYGPTEAAVDVTWWQCRGEEEGHRLPIGRPIANTSLFILDKQGRPVPIGVAGELCLGGVNLARGYHGQVAQTAEKFIPHAFGGEAGARLYRTGDLCRFRADGAVEYLGRIDAQVKLRGFRIELGEIESVLREQSAVDHAVVAVLPDPQGESRLVAFLEGPQGTFERVDAHSPVLACRPEIQLEQVLRGQLRQRLPEYMIPSQFVLVERIPLTPSGKANRRALPNPGTWQTHQTYVAPRTETEEKLVELWRKILPIDKIGVADDFFELGGHSLLATQVITGIQETFSLNVPLVGFMSAPTVAQLAALVESAGSQGEEATSIKRVAREGRQRRR